MMKSPFNFVPCPDKVFYPDSLGKPSIDIPFSDAVSGTLEIKITAQTPIFVRNGHTKNDHLLKNTEYESFSIAPDGRYFIPAATVKGCIRNVLAIISNGEQHIDPRAAFTQRDFNNPNLYTIKSPAVQTKIHCGWLRYDKSEHRYQIEDCGTPKRISMAAIDNWLQKRIFKEAFESRQGKTLEPEQKTAKYKYENLLRKKCGVTFDNLNLKFNLTPDDPRKCTIVPNDYLGGNAVFEGNLVLTGQPGLANDWERRVRGSRGKYYEFVFPQKTGTVYDIEDSVFERYDYMYSDSEDWQYHKERLYSSGIPVFFRVSKDTGRGVEDFGVAFMYKLPYKRSPFDIEAKRHVGSGVDMAKRIFGFSSPQESLKGRVVFSNFFCIDDKPELGESQALILGAPKASYYPVYLKQNSADGTTANYKTYEDDDAKLAGWKMYLRRNETWSHKTGDEKLDTRISPLAAGSIFVGTVSFHNLRPEELGALISAITFCGIPGMSHMIGQGKPYGFGRVSMEIETDTSLRDIKGNEIALNDASERFLNYLMDNGIDVFRDSSELFHIAGTPVSKEEKFKYMTLGMNAGDNEFINAKRDKETLRKFSSLKFNQKLNCQIESKSRDLESLRAKRQRKLEEERERDAELEEEEKKRAEREAESKRKKAEEEKKKEDDRLKNSVPLRERIADVKTMGNLVGTTKKWLSVEPNEFGPNEFDAMFEAIVRIKPKDKELKKFRGDVQKLIGEEMCNKLYNELK